MEAESTYVHALNGRLRIKVAGVRGSPAGALRVEAHLRARRGVLTVVPNALTGNVLVCYDPTTTHRGDIVMTLRELGCLPYTPPNGDRVPHGRLLVRLAGAVAQAATEAALQQALTALM